VEVGARARAIARGGEGLEIEGLGRLGILRFHKS
jgi:hypothetical protein